MTTHDNMNNIGSISHWDVSQVSQLRNETLGGRFRRTYINQEIGRIIEPALKVLSESKRPDVRKGVQEIISALMEIMIELSKSKFDVSSLPSLVAANLDDGSFLIEWLFTNYRVGFVVERELKESIWYLITRGESSDTNSSGSLDIPDKKDLLAQLISYVIVNT